AILEAMVHRINSRQRLALGLIVVLLVTKPPILHAAQKGFCNGDGFAFWFSVPENWVLDNAAGARLHVCAVAYPKGGDSDHSPAVMYVRPMLKLRKSVQVIIDEDVAEFRKGKPTLKVEGPRQIETDDHHKGYIYRFEGSGVQRFEDVAYIDNPSYVALFVLSS